MAAVLSLAELRAALPAARPRVERLGCHHEGLDAWLGGWPTPGVTEVCGAPGTGRLALLRPTIVALLQAHQPVVVVDPWQQFHPPGLGAGYLGLVLVRPPPEQAAWAAEQVARTGAAMVVLDPPPLGRGGRRIARAAEAGGSVVWIVTNNPDPDVPAALRLQAEGWEDGAVNVRCTRGREGQRRLSFREG